MMKTLHPSASWTNDGQILLNVILVIVIYFSSAIMFVDCQGPAYLYGTSVTFPCAVTEMGSVAYTWRDVGSSKVIYFILSSDESSKHPEVDGIAKYDNFGIINNHPSSVDLTIDSFDFNDDGIYRCTPSRGEAPPDELVVVEATPISVNVSCTRNQANCPQTVGNSDEFICSCEAVGAYPDTLVLTWSNVEGNPATEPPTNSTQRPGAYNYTSTATFIPTENKKTATCTVGGYSGSWNVEEDDYPTAPPVCQLETSCNGNNTGVTLTCKCDGAIPSDGLSYSFFQDDVFIPSGDTNNSIEVSIEPDRDYVFGCRQCNGVNYGQESYSMADVICTDGTTALPTTTDPTEITFSTPDSNTAATVTTPTTSTGKKGNPTGATGPPVGLIVGLSIGIPILIIILVLAIWFFKNRGGGHTKHTSDPPQSDDPVIAMNASTTSSLAPLYQDVKKEKKKKSDDSVSTSGDKETPVSKEMSPAVYAVPDKKKKSDKPDGNGAGPESSQPTYADVNKPTQPTAAPRTSQKVPDSQPMQELQYAELDHGKQPPTNEIRKPQGEPTEYATVQSVIV